MTKANYFLFLLCLLFLFFKIYAIYVTDLDLFGDEAQYWLWSQNLDLGYYSKPPLLAWVIALVCSLFGNSVFVIKIISVFMYCATSYIIFLITNKLFKNNLLAIITALSFFVMPGVTVSSFIISTDVLLILFWSLSVLQLLKIKEIPNIFNFILLGIFIGIAFLAKYVAIYFILCTIVLLWLDKDIRYIFFKKKFGFFYFLLSFCLIIAPNIVWNLKNGWVTLYHTVDNAALDKININFWGGVEFFGSQIFMVGPLIFLFFIFGFKTFIFNSKTKFLLIFSLPIFLIILIEAFLVRAHANWAAVSLISFLILFIHTVYQFGKTAIFFNNIVNLLFGFILFFLISTNSSYEPFKRISGITSFANIIKKEFSEEGFNDLVVSDRMLFSNLKYIYRNNTITMFTPYTPDSLIRHHFQLTHPLPSNINKSFIYVGNINELNYLQNQYTIKLLSTNEVVFKNGVINTYEIIF